MSGYHILTFNWHEGYLCLLAGTGHRFDVVQRTKAGLWFWLYGTRDVPDNVSLVHPEDARARLQSRRYDLAVCHNFADCEELAPFDVPRALVFHNYRETELTLARARGRSHPAERAEEAARRAGDAHPVFISEGKKTSWGLEGTVIPPGVDVDAFRGYEGRRLQVLRVGNFLLERDAMLGGELQRAALRGIPHTTLGLNPGIRGAALSSSFDALREAYRSHRAYLHTTRAPFEDGHNLALLEAMATGMPVVAAAHPGSPVVDGVSGLVGDGPEAIRRGLFALLEDHDLARRLGGQARESVAERFPLERFVQSWQEVFERLAGQKKRPARALRAPRRRVLYLYTPSAARAGFIERALRDSHHVVSAGLFDERLDGLRFPDIVAGPHARLREIWRALPPGFEPEVVVAVTDDPAELPNDVEDVDVPSWGVLLGSRADDASSSRVARTWRIAESSRHELAPLLEAIQTLDVEAAEASSASGSSATMA